jgi:GPH family glycoside/pentoside/hexuronide:cation symporter
MAKTKTASPTNGLTKKHWVGYMMGDLGGCMTFALMGSMVTRYYTNVLHINTVVLASLLLVWNVWDAVNDPMMGALMDKVFAKHQNPKGKFRPWLLRSAPLLAISAIVFWTVPSHFEGTALLVVLFCCKLFYEGMYTMFNIPMGSLLSAMANTDEERASLSSARGFGGMIGNVLPLMILPQLLAKYGDTAQAFGIGGTICALIGLVFCLLHYYWTEERNISTESSSDSNDIKFTDILDVFKRNRAFLALCLHGVCICTMQYVASTLGTYMYADVLGNVGLMSLTSVLSMPIMLVILVISPKLAKKFGLENLIRTTLLMGCGLYVALFAAHAVTTVNPYVHMVWSTLASGVGMVSIQMQWGLIGEAIDYNEYLTGKRTEGSIYGTFNLARRIGQTVGNSAAVLALGWIGYNDAAGAVQTAGTLMGIKVLCVLLPGLFLLGSWAAFKFVWNITPETRAAVAAFKAKKSGQIVEG